MKKIFKQITRLVLTSVCILLGVSCESDAWKNHYSVKSYGNESVASLAQTISDIPEAGRFVEVLKSTYMYNGDKQTSLTYWDFLNDNQYLTVWLPDPAQITESEWESYMADDKDHKKVGTEFILNHIARFSHPVGDDANESIKMMSNKTYKSKGHFFDGVGYKEKNIRCTNGLLHKLDGHIVYKPNIYDYLTGAFPVKSASGNMYDYKPRIGEWISSFMDETLDEEKSIEGGLNDKGETEYIDKVYKRKNSILEKYGFIDVEDSDFIVVLPTPSVWDAEYERIKSYYSYDPEDQTLADKVEYLQEYYTKSAMITDVFFNRNLQKHIGDSITSTLFKKSERMREEHPYHVYYKPYKKDHLLGAYNDETQKGVIDSVICSNGVIYVRNDWPYSDSVFRKPIRIEAEDIPISGANWYIGRKIAQYKDKNGNIRMSTVKEISHLSDEWKASFSLKDNLKGKYKIKMLFFRNTEEDMESKVNIKVDFIGSNALSASSYDGKDINGRKNNNETVGTEEFKIDTVCVGYQKKGKTFNFPYGNYGNESAKIRLSLENIPSGGATTKIVWLDCIILEPVF